MSDNVVKKRKRLEFHKMYSQINESLMCTKRMHEEASEKRGCGKSGERFVAGIREEWGFSIEEIGFGEAWVAKEVDC